MIECFVCPLLYDTRYHEQKLWGEGKLYSDEGKLYSAVHSLSDLHYWHDRNRQAKLRDFERIQERARSMGKTCADDRNGTCQQ